MWPMAIALIRITTSARDDAEGILRVLTSMRRRRVCRGREWLAGVLVFLGTSQAISQDSMDDRLGRLEARIEAVERENAELRDALLDHSLPPRPIDSSLGTEPGEVFDNNAQDDRIRSLVRETYHELDADRRRDEQHYTRLPQESPDDELLMTASWKHGVTLRSKDADFQLHIGGRTQFDAAFFGLPQDIQTDPRIITPWGDGVGFRRARIKLDGTMYHFIEWATQFDFVNSTRDGTNVKTVIAPTDLWWTFTQLPVVGNWRTGNVKEPIGFEHLVSSRFLPFMERSFNQDAFYGGFNNGFTPGTMLFNTALDERMTWAVGVFKPTSNVFAASTNTGDYATTGRLTFLPYYECDGEQLLHLGVSGRFASTFDHQIQFRTRGPERSGLSAQWPLPADTRNFFGDSMQFANFEVVGVRGPWTFQSEYLGSWVQDNVRTAAGVPTDTVLFHGGYAQILYYLTGEHDLYNKQAAAFERPIPHDNAVIADCGPSACYPWGWLSCGAWQVGVRYNYLDLNDSGVNGGVLQDVTCGLNWFLNPNVKIQWNYSATHRATADNTGEGFIHGFGVRLAHDF